MKDLSEVLEAVASKSYERYRAEAYGRGFHDIPTWEQMSEVGKEALRKSVRPTVSDTIDALEAQVVKPATMREYGYTDSRIHGTNPEFYENIDSMHDPYSCTVWVLHLNIQRQARDTVLNRLAQLPEVTGEYTFGDSWKEWGEPAHDESDLHMAVYFNAPPERAASVGQHLADHAAFATVEALGRDAGPLPAYAVSTSGDYANQLEQEQ